MTAAEPLPLHSVTNVEYWRALAPGLSIEEDQLPREAPRGSIADDIRERVLEQIRLEGYCTVHDVIPREHTDRAAESVRAVVRAGFPPLFSLVYDEMWRALGAIGGPLDPVLGADWRIVPDLWVWFVDPAEGARGWRVHRDLNSPEPAIREDGRPQLLTAWVPLVDVTTDDSCIYVLPLDHDPNYPSKTVPHSITPENLAHVRALPCPAGSVLMWNQCVLHWGSVPSRWSTNPRISFGMFYQSGDARPFTEYTIGRDESLTFLERLGVIGRSMLAYNGSHEDRFSDELLDLCRRLTALANAVRTVKTKRGT